MHELPPAMIDWVTPAADWVVVLPLVLCLIGSALALMLRRSGTPGILLAVLFTSAVMVCDVALLLRVYAEGPLSMTMGRWLPPFGISFTADLFGAAFALAAAVVTLVVLIYAEASRADNAQGDGFHSLVLLLLAGVTGSFLTGDLFNLYVWFEVMLIASFGLIVAGGQPAQLDGAVKYGFINFLATTFFLLALGLLYGLLGTLNMADILRVAPSANPAAMTGIAALLLMAFGMKAAAFPLNAWLPASYHTPPAAVSALFAGLLTKVGVYALLRSLVVILPATREVLEPVILALAAATLVIGPLGAVAETNLRRALGFIVIGGIGAALVGIALPSRLGAMGAGLYILHSLLTMPALYLVAGLIERRSGVRDSRYMGGFYAASAPLSIIFLGLVLAAAGIPPLLGFWPKLVLLQASLEQGGWAGGILTGALLLNAFLTLIAGSRLWAQIFWRAPQVQPIAPEPSTRFRVAQGMTLGLAAIILAIGLWPNPAITIMQRGVADIVAPERYVAAFGLAEDEQ